MVGLFKYVTYDEQDFVHMQSIYDFGGGPGYDKPNVTANAHPESRNWPLQVDAIFTSTSAGGCDVYVHLKSLDTKPRKFYGCPSDVWVRYTWRNRSSNGANSTNHLLSSSDS